jgi:antitoxin component YwqK of YwqJK toxin-antitoxin module
MSHRRRTWLWLGIITLLFGAIFFGLGKWSHSRTPLREALRSELELRDGVLCTRGEVKPFQGKLVENYAAGLRKLEIDIRDGKPNGLSRGWYENRQLEVEETFRDGTSHGPRTRWFDNGQRKSLAQIENGKVVAEFLEWHANGQLATRMTLHGGQPEGLVESWYPSGAVKSRTQLERGRQISRQFFDDFTPIVANE